MKEWIVDVCGIALAMSLIVVALLQEPIPDQPQPPVIIESVDAEIVQRMLAMIGDDSEFMIERNAILKRLKELERKPPNMTRPKGCN